jgi:hypothetical protein
MDAVLLAFAWKDRAGTPVNRRDPVVPHEPGNPRTTDVRVMVAAQHLADLALSEGGILQMDRVDVSAEGRVPRRLDRVWAATGRAGCG